MQKALLFPILLLLFLTQSFFQCGKCEPDVWYYQAKQLKTAHLNTSGLFPLTIISGAQGDLDHYGLRLFIESEMLHPEDTLKEVCESVYLALFPQITDCAIYAVNGIGNEYPPGALVSNFFRYADRRTSPLRYFSVTEAAAALTQPSGNGFDFNMTTPAPAAGWYQFEIRLLRGDSSALSITTDSVFLQ